MKKAIIFIGTIIILTSCSKEKSVEERYLYEVDKVVDIETGDEYIMEEENEIIVVHTDGSKEIIPIEEAPFYGSTLSEDYLRYLEEKMRERKDKLLEEKKNEIKAMRRSRYASISDEELLKQFQKGHQEGIEMSRQMDMIAELIERGVVSSEEAPDLLEISPELIDFEIEIEKPIDN
ncbi:hypothetical protein [Cecembia rubra]|uniref:Uncharacterized protein n=1 Tax=Cecembia rubra TaxID=1485585 RepID=A0A2P8E6K1_9BACT|nr:hypothetical protein [Cecembia rubra]PSL05057.1 hypothetical protein CLV48_104232 [Cecembia rubra]